MAKEKLNNSPASLAPPSPLKGIATSALLVDGSALFFGQRSVSADKNLDYFALDEILKQRSSGPWPPKPAYFFTAADDANEKQGKFHELIESMGWTVRPTPPHEATTANPLLTDQNTRLIRFDAMIAYALGRLAGRSEFSRIFIVSDSWPLAGPVRDCTARTGTPVTICFFGSVIDTRWHKLFRESNPQADQLDFLDLEVFAQRLFNRDRTSRRKESNVLHDLP